MLCYVKHLFHRKFAVADCTFHAEPATDKRSFAVHQIQPKSAKYWNSNAQGLPVESQLVVVLLAWPAIRVNEQDDGKG